MPTSAQASGRGKDVILFDANDEAPLEIADQHRQSIRTGVAGSETMDGAAGQLPVKGLRETQDGEALGGEPCGLGGADQFGEVRRRTACTR